MFKKICVIFSVLTVFTLAIFHYCLPVFYGYTEKFTVCFNDASSSGLIEETDLDGFPLFNKYGESFSVEKGKISVGEILYRFNAERIFTEKIAEGISYYAYSGQIPYAKTIGKYKVNLHIFVGENKIVVGTPIIFGSF